MGTVARGSKLGGGTNYNSGQLILASEMNTDLNTLYTELNALLDDANIETATIPGAKSFRFTEIAAPGTPAANDTLLYAIDRDGTTTLEYKDSGGVVVSLGRQACRVTNSGTQTVSSAGSPVLLTWNTETFDRGGFHSTSTNTGRLTVPHAGLYYVSVQATITANATATVIYRLHIRLNGTTNISEAMTNNTTVSATLTLNTGTIYQAAAGDYFDSTYSINAGTDVTVATDAFFAITCLGG